MGDADRSVIVVGAGIGGLTTALSLHEIGVAVDVFDRVAEVLPWVWASTSSPMRSASSTPWDCSTACGTESVEPESLMYCSRHGHEIWREPRGAAAGYPWPQLSMHRGALQEVLLDAFVERLGADHLHLGTGSCGWRAATTRRQPCSPGPLGRGWATDR